MKLLAVSIPPQNPIRKPEHRHGHRVIQREVIRRQRRRIRAVHREPVHRVKSAWAQAQQVPKAMQHCHSVADRALGCPDHAGMRFAIHHHRASSCSTRQTSRSESPDTAARGQGQRYPRGASKDVVGSGRNRVVGRTKAARGPGKRDPDRSSEVVEVVGCLRNRVVHYSRPRCGTAR